MNRLDSGNTSVSKNRRLAAMYLLLSVLIPAIIIVAALVGLRVYPVGDHNIAIIDGRWYINGTVFLGRLMRGEENLLFSFNNGLGGNEWSQLAWGALAPVRCLLSVFVNLDNAIVLFTCISILNMSLCGLTMYLLLAELCGHRAGNLIFSTSYALMGFNVVNCFQTLFFIGPQMLPLMVLGLIRLMRGKSPLLYILSLCFCIFSNFYFGFHLCAASLVLFLAFLYLKGDTLTVSRKRIFGRYMASSVAAGLIPCFFWLPALKAYTGGGRLEQTTLSEYQFSENMPFLQIFSKLFTGANSKDEMINGLPNIFCGILVVALVILFFLNHRISVKKRRTAAVVLAFYLLTFYLPAFTILMHGGTHTNWFPYRYSYVFSFLLIGLAAEQFLYLEEITLRETRTCGTVILAAALLVFGTRYEFVTGGAVLLDLALLLLMWAAFYLYKTKPEKAPLSTLNLFLLLVVSINLYANYIISIHNVQEWEKDLEAYTRNSLYTGSAVEALRQADKSFYRIEQDEPESGQIGADASLYNYNGVSGSGPAYRMFIHKQLNKLGINWYDMRHWYEKGIPAGTDALLGLKYLLSDRDLETEKGYECLIQTDGQDIYQNPYALSAAILADEACTAVELGNDAFQNLNAVWRAMAGGDRDIFHEVSDVSFSIHNDFMPQSVTSAQLREMFPDSRSESSGEKGKESEAPTLPNNYIEYTFDAVFDGPVYNYNSLVPETTYGLSGSSTSFIGVYRDGETVTDRFPVTASTTTGELMRNFCSGQVFASADNAVLAEYAEKLNSRDITFNAEHEHDLTGEFTAAPGQVILFTIPWDEGWTATIDGQPVPIIKTWDLFMSLEAPEGHHTYELKFFPAWMDYGLYISGAALLGFVVLMIVWKKKQKTLQNVAAPETEIAEVIE